MGDTISKLTPDVVLDNMTHVIVSDIVNKCDNIVKDGQEGAQVTARDIIQAYLIDAECYMTDDGAINRTQTAALEASGIVPNDDLIGAVKGALTAEALQKCIDAVNMAQRGHITAGRQTTLYEAWREVYEQMSSCVRDLLSRHGVGSAAATIIEEAQRAEGKKQDSSGGGFWDTITTMGKVIVAGVVLLVVSMIGLVYWAIPGDQKVGEPAPAAPPVVVERYIESPPPQQTNRGDLPGAAVASWGTRDYDDGDDNS